MYYRSWFVDAACGECVKRDGWVSNELAED
jgi:hypothetical protein